MMLGFRMIVPSQMIVLAALMIVTLSLSICVFTPAFAQNSPNTTNQNSLNNTMSASSQKITINAKGPIASALKDNNGTWITWGNWELVNNASNAVGMSSNPITFNASITKVKRDNTESIKYKIYDFKLDNSDIKTVGTSSILVFNGTGTIETKGAESPQVPIDIMIIDSAPVTASIDMQSGDIKPSWVPGGGTISIMIDDNVFAGHFGDLPIYGIVRKG
jgi:hypothetical protein